MCHTTGDSLHRGFFVLGGMSVNLFLVDPKKKCCSVDQTWKGSVGNGEEGERDTGGKSDRSDDIEEERDDNRGDDTEDSKTRTTRMTRRITGEGHPVSVLQ